jgi:hypothetical protein
VYLSAYLPRTPPEKSYSARIFVDCRVDCRVDRRLEGGFFIAASFMASRRPRADQTNTLVSNSLNHNQQIPLAGHSDNHVSRFVYRMTGPEW